MVCEYIFFKTIKIILFFLRIRERERERERERRRKWCGGPWKKKKEKQALEHGFWLKCWVVTWFLLLKLCNLRKAHGSCFFKAKLFQFFFRNCYSSSLDLENTIATPKEFFYLKKIKHLNKKQFFLSPLVSLF